MYKLTYIKWLILIVTVLTTDPSIAADTCVTNSTEFQAALNTAENNGEGDIIRLKRGEYPIINGTAFSYNAAVTEDHDLKIIGGFIQFINNPCGLVTLNNSAFETELDGLSLNRVLNIRPTGISNIEISALYFVAGDATATSPTRGGGLYISRTGHTGDILIENNAFVANSAQAGSALFVSSGNKITVRNNFVLANNAESGAAIELVNNQLGIYFTNNTVLANNTDGTAITTAAVKLGTGSNSTQAFIANNILWNNEVRDLRFTPITYLYNNDIGVYSGTPVDESNNISAEPGFESTGPGGLSFTPAYNSNLHNQGIEPPIFAPIPTPFESDWELGNNDTFGRDRVVNGRIDIGSFETPPETPIFIDGFEG